MAKARMVSERVGQFFHERHRLEYTEYGTGNRWVVLIHGQLMVRRMHRPLARALAAEGLHVVTVDMLGHGRSDRPDDPRLYSMSAFAEQVVELLDHVGAEKAVIGGTSLGANVSLEVAVAAPERVQGLIIEMPVLDNALEAGLIAFGPMLFAARFLPFTVNLTRAVSRAVPRGMVPFWTGIVLDTMNQRPRPMAAAIHGIFFGRIAPGSKLRRAITAPMLVIGHPRDPVHPAADAAMLAGEVAGARFVRARSILEWRLTPERLDREAAEFAVGCWDSPRGQREVGT
jgi:pimeloyl-ACP methyl ester carboxylesterase